MKILQVNIFKLSSKNLTSVQMIHLLETLSNLLKSGFTLLESFEFINLYFKYRDKELKNKIIASIKSGETCYEVLNLIGYPNSITTQIYFSQKYGNLEDALEESIKYLKTNLSAKQQVIKAVQYPLLLCCIFMCMIVVLNYTVIPQFEQLYISLDVNLSFYQKFLTSMITSFPAFIIFFITILILIFVILTIVLLRIETSKKIIILSSIPLFNSYYKIFKTYQISNDLSLFYKNGVSLQDIVTTYIKQNDNEYLRFLGEFLMDKTNSGETLANSLAMMPCFQKDLIKFIEQGEKSAKLDIELKIYSSILINRFKEKSLLHTKIIQPIIFLFLGLFIVSLYLVIMLPMFQLMQNIK